MAQVNGIFDSVTYQSPKESDFSAQHDIKTACRVGEVIPLDCVPVYGGDRFRNYTIAKQCKFNPLVAPSFQKMVLKSWSFYTRNSDLWDDFDTFYTGINPKNGRTAYTGDVEPVHPYIKMNATTQCGTAYLGVKLVLSDVDLSQIVLDGAQIAFSTAVLKHCCEQVKKNGLTLGYEDTFIKDLFCLGYDDTTSQTQFGYSALDVTATLRDLSLLEVLTGDSGFNIGTFYDTAVNTDNITFPIRNISNFQKIKGLKPIFSPSSVSDYLGYPVTDFKSFIFSDKFNEYIRKNSDINEDFSILSTIIEKNGHLYNGYTDYDLLSRENLTGLSNVQFMSFPVFNNITGDLEELSAPLLGNSRVFLDDGQDETFQDTTSSGETYMLELIVRYLAWMKITKKNTTLVDDAPYFNLIPLSNIVNTSDCEVDSLRIRGYHKLWNDYFREPSLTAEIPVPYKDGGNDMINYYNSVQNYFTEVSPITGDRLFDWRKEDVFSQRKYQYLPAIDDARFYYQMYSRGLGEYSKLLVMWDLLSEPFKHVRVRDYLTGCMPTTGVVDVVAPVMAPNIDGLYQNGAYTNNPLSIENDLVKLDNTEVNPIPATLDNPRTSPVGWLDIENLEITKKIKEYFVTLRHAFNGIKDYMRVFFDVDIDNQTIRRARFLGADEQYISISEVVSQSEYENSPLGSLAGRATSFGQSNGIDFDVKECGFFITLTCLSPLTQNVGGLNRQLLRQTRFDYFNPKFSELGDMSVTKKEVSIMPIMKGQVFQYDDLFGYTQRYMDCKYIESKVHSDFLGTLSDWHLDQIQPAITDFDNINLSQSWLEEREDDRIFAEVNEDANTCVIWCEVNGVFTRKLPRISREVIA